MSSCPAALTIQQNNLNPCLSPCPTDLVYLDTKELCDLHCWFLHTVTLPWALMVVSLPTPPSFSKASLTYSQVYKFVMDILEVKDKSLQYEEIKTPKTGYRIWLPSKFKESKNKCKHFKVMHFFGRPSIQQLSPYPLILPLSRLFHLYSLVSEPSNLENLSPFNCSHLHSSPEHLFLLLPSTRSA